MVDDTLTITEAGQKTQQMNAHFKVDIWKQTHDDKNVFHESFDQEYNLTETNQTKYLGYFLSSDGSNLQNIKK